MKNIDISDIKDLLRMVMEIPYDQIEKIYAVGQMEAIKAALCIKGLFECTGYSAATKSSFMQLPELYNKENPELMRKIFKIKGLFGQTEHLVYTPSLNILRMCQAEPSKQVEMRSINQESKMPDMSRFGKNALKKRLHRLIDEYQQPLPPKLEDFVRKESENFKGIDLHRCVILINLYLSHSTHKLGFLSDSLFISKFTDVDDRVIRDIISKMCCLVRVKGQKMFYLSDMFEKNNKVPKPTYRIISETRKNYLFRIDFYTYSR